MKHALIVFVTTVLLPIPVMADEQSAWKHMYETHFLNDQTKDGYFAVSVDGQNGRSFMPNDEWQQNSPFGAQVSNDQPQSTDTIFKVGPPSELIYVNHVEKTFGTMNEESIQRQSKQLEQAWGQMGLDPDSQEARDVTNALAKAFGTVNDSKRQSLESEIEKEQSPSRKKEMQEYVDKKFPQSSEGTSQEVTKTGESCRQSGINGQVYSDESGGRLVEMCIAAWDTVKGGLVTKEMQEGMFGFMKNLMKGVPMVAQSAFESRPHQNGFPILTKIFRNGRLVSETTYLRTVKTKVSFTVPGSYTPEREGFGMITSPRKSKTVENPDPEQSSADGKTTKSEDICELTEEGIVCKDNPAPETSRRTQNADAPKGKGKIDAEEAVNKLKGILDLFK